MMDRQIFLQKNLKRMHGIYYKLYKEEEKQCEKEMKQLAFEQYKEKLEKDYKFK